MVPPTTGTGVNPARAAFRLTVGQLREHAGTTFGAAAIQCIPLAFVSVYTAMRPGWSGIALGIVAGGLVGAWVAYAATVATANYVDGKDPGYGGLLSQSLSAGLIRYGLTSLLVTLVTGLVAVLALLPLVLSVGSLGADAVLSGRISEADAVRVGAGLLVSLPLLIVALLIVYLKLGLSATASALDGTNPAASLRRSWDVTKGHIGHFFLLTLMSLAVSLAVSLVVSGPAGLVSAAPEPDPAADPMSVEVLADLFGPGEPLSLPAALVTGVSTYLTAVILSPFTAGLLANFFLVLRKPSPKPEPAGGVDPEPKDVQTAATAPAEPAGPAEGSTEPAAGGKPGPPDD